MSEETSAERKLRALERMHAAGMVTDAEYQAKRVELVDRAVDEAGSVGVSSDVSPPPSSPPALPPAWVPLPSGPPPSGPPVGRTGLDHSRAWLLALAPLLLLCLDVALDFSGVPQGVTTGVLVAGGINTVLAIWDSTYLNKRGIHVWTLLGILLVPGYLAQRSRRLGLNQGPLVVWILAFGISVAGDAILSSNFVTLDMAAVQSRIAQTVDQQASTTATVSCPSKSVYAVHSSFLCTVTDPTGSATVQVTVQDSDGALTWQAAPAAN